MNRTRGKNRPVAEINVVPYIDVMMVLLVIFIATAPVVMQGVTVDLPQAQSEPMSEDSKAPIVCTVDKDGKFFVEFKGEAINVSSLKELTDRVRREIAIDPKIPVVVQGDKNATYNSVMVLMNALKSAGVESVGLVTEPMD
ncbi:MAG: protein TolR [Succinivibrionaceae bacterium]|nr:protein TolR [Ruminobacter sp.]MEE1339847.1 protein TolR [Succinivibrionaceae bacterium]